MTSPHWTVFRGIDTRTLDMYQERAPDQVIPSRRVERIEIPGRDGALESWDGAYNAYQRTAEYIIRDISRLDRIRALLTGSGWVTFDDEPHLQAKASIANQTDIVREVLQYRRMQVIFDIQPYKYERWPQPIVLTAGSGTALERVLPNPGTAPARPVLSITGNSYVTVTMQGQAFRVRVGSGITVDCELEECYNAYGGNLNRDMTGVFPIIQPGECPVLIQPEGTAVLTIRPNWRWL